MSNATPISDRVATYDALFAECGELIERLERQLDEHATIANANTEVWGVVGDLNRVRDLLREANEFMRYVTYERKIG